MEHVIESTENFDFSKLSLSHPSGIQGGAYFTKIEYNNKPLYIQTTKSLTRQGFVKSGKKYYCDLMFDKNSDKLIHWFENLEEKCQKLIFEKKNAWFQNSLEESDIETAFNSIIRVYRSGKFYLVRTNIKNNQLNVPIIKIYNENEVELKLEDITNEKNIISILEIQGIKFTSRNFQIEIELKQVMALDSEPIFDNCLIKSSKNPQANNEILETKPLEMNPLEMNPLEMNPLEMNPLEMNPLEMNPLEMNNLEMNPLETNDKLNETNTKQGESSLENITREYLPEALDTLNDESDRLPEQTGVDEISLNIVDLDLDNNDVEENTKELKEIEMNIPLENNLETITLKKPNQVYFELYKEARNKAKQAKKSAILSYLEAKNIRKTYMLDNLNDSDSDFDAEIDEVSESELEGL